MRKSGKILHSREKYSVDRINDSIDTQAVSNEFNLGEGDAERPGSEIDITPNVAKDMFPIVNDPSGERKCCSDLPKKYCLGKNPPAEKEESSDSEGDGDTGKKNRLAFKQ